MFQPKGKSLLAVVFGLFFLLAASFVHAGDDVDAIVQSLLTSEELALSTELGKPDSSNLKCFYNQYEAANYLFDWAQSVNAQAFPRGPVTQQTGDGIRFRAYPTGLILATYNEHFFIHQGQWAHLGSVNEWARSLAARAIIGTWNNSGRQTAVDRSSWEGFMTMSPNGAFYWEVTRGNGQGQTRNGRWGVSYDCKFQGLFENVPRVGWEWWESSSPNSIRYNTTIMSGTYRTQAGPTPHGWGGPFSANKRR